VVPPPFPGLGTGYPIQKEHGVGRVTHPDPIFENQLNRKKIKK
jgi:hypothetical protein